MLFCESKPLLLVVLPTRGRTILLAMITPLLFPKAVIIFVAPCRALVNDMVQQFQCAED